jgi:hypothetical protein
MSWPASRGFDLVTVAAVGFMSVSRPSMQAEPCGDVVAFERHHRVPAFQMPEITSATGSLGGWPVLGCSIRHTLSRAFFVKGIAYVLDRREQSRSGIFAKESIAGVHLRPLFHVPLNEITTERVQRLKATLVGRKPTTINNVLTVLGTVLKKAVEWGVMERMPCAVRLLPAAPPSARFMTSMISSGSWRRQTWRSGSETRRNHGASMGGR